MASNSRTDLRNPQAQSGANRPPAETKLAIAYALGDLDRRISAVERRSVAAPATSSAASAEIGAMKRDIADLQEAVKQLALAFQEAMGGSSASSSVVDVDVDPEAS